jgi:sugar phosphate isomerase/epimerase
MYSRRDFGKLALAAVPLAAAAAPKINSKIDGVQIGAQSYSFRDRPLDGAIEGMKEVGLGECELFMGHVEPRGMRGEQLKQWRISAPDQYFHDIRKKFDDAGIELYAYTFNFNNRMSDEELDNAFRHTLALGTRIITTSTTMTCAKRVAPLADKHKVKVALHGHDNIKDPEEFAKPESFAQGMALSKQFYINLDIGHFVSAGYDPVAYIDERHAKILALHLKDRTKDHKNLPFGEGETPIKQVLQQLKTKKYRIPANIEYEYGNDKSDAVAEVKKCYEFCKAALA